MKRQRQIYADGLIIREQASRDRRAVLARREERERERQEQEHQVAGGSSLGTGNRMTAQRAVRSRSPLDRSNLSRGSRRADRGRGGRGGGGRGGGLLGGARGSGYGSGFTSSSHDEYDESAASEEVEDQAEAGKERKRREKEEGISAKIPLDILLLLTPIALKEGMTIRMLVMIVAAFLIICDVDLDSVYLSTSTCQKYRKNEAERISDEILDDFKKQVKNGVRYEGAEGEGYPVVWHVDGKLIEQDFGGVRQLMHRIVSILSSPWLNRDQLVCVAPLEHETGYAVALEVHTQAEGLDLVPNSIAVVADTPNVNFGQEEGALQHICRMFEKDLLQIPCVHHTEQLPPSAVAEAVSGRKSTGPEDPLLQKIKSNWNLIKASTPEDVEYKIFDWEENEGTPQGEAAKEVLDWAKDAKRTAQYSRGDYMSALNLVLLFLGSVLGLCTLPRPARISKARFLQIGLYYLTVFLLLDIPEVAALFTQQEIVEIQTMAEFCALHYIPFMLKAKYAASAPRNLLTAIHRLRSIRVSHPVVAAVALQKRELHLNFLSPELVIFAIFDDQVPVVEREAMAKKLYSFRHQFVPGDRLIYQLFIRLVEDNLLE